MPTIARISALLVVVMATGCKGPEARQASSDTTPAVPVLTESSGALATRHEVQGSLDRARAAFEQKQLQTMRAELANAAAFFRSEAQQAKTDAGVSLRGAAAELDSLATQAAKGELPTVMAVDRALINANRAEARFHLLRAGDAIATRQNDRGGEELTMSVDHLERAAKDAGLQTDAAVRTAIADARTLAGEMMKGMGVVPDEARRVTQEVERAIDRIGTGGQRVRKEQ